MSRYLDMKAGPSDTPEHLLPREKERKFVPADKSAEAQVREWLYRSTPVEQIYLSHPDEPFSLRVRQAGEKYTATLKTRPDYSKGLLDRIEIEASISAITYERYREDPRYPRLQKSRADLGDGVTIDWFSHIDTPLIEVETTDGSQPNDPTALGVPGKFDEVTNHPWMSNEIMAHDLWRRQIGYSALLPQPELKLTDILGDIEKKIAGKGAPLVIGIRGRSGSGKSTITAQLAESLEAKVGPVLRLSTDDYNLGMRHMLHTHKVDSWSNWDVPEVYDTELLARELKEYLDNGTAIPIRQYNFITQEPEVITDVHPPASVIIVEGLFSHSTDLSPVLDMLYELPTPLATCVGRRIMRDAGSRMNASLPTVNDILRYLLEVVEPAYLAHT